MKEKIEGKALKWWNKHTLEEKCHKTIKYAHLKESSTRHPYSLKIEEIVAIYLTQNEQ